MNKLFFIFMTVIFLSPVGWTNSAYASRKPLRFTIDNTTFFKNLEYNDITEVAKGETITGNVVKPYFTYHFKKGLKAEVGAILQFNFGDDRNLLERGDPLISLHYDMIPGWRLTAGTLNRNHQLLDALFNDNQTFTDPVEQGFQIRAKTKHLTEDLWIDWERRETATKREKFSIGNVTQFRKDGFMLDGQILWNHFGGQKNTGGEVSNNFNIAFGGGMTFRPPGKTRGSRLIDRFGFKVHYIYTNDKPRSLTEAVEPDSKSSGVVAELFAVVGGTNVFLKTWNGSRTRGSDSGQTFVTTPFLDGIRSDKGDPLYRAEDFVQIGLNKLWKITDEVDIYAELELTKVREQIVHVDTLSVRWRTNFPIWEKTAKATKTVPAVITQPHNGPSPSVRTQSVEDDMLDPISTQEEPRVNRKSSPRKKRRQP
ncbi:MAG: hypothetical protein QGH96_15505 [Desulfobacterales bacterium]|jgi:hypothetical protein|nr:hypothetical protein [Desulfobacterales bacterium]